MPSDNQGRLTIQFGYYLIQLRTEVLDGTVRTSGTLEDLRSGERFPFSGLGTLAETIERARDEEHRSRTMPAPEPDVHPTPHTLTED